MPAVLLAAALAACSSAPDPAPDRAPEAGSEWTVELSTAPTHLLLTADDVLAASLGNGYGGSQLYRVDRTTARLVEQHTLAGEPYGMALGPDGRLWLATVRLPDQPGGTGLQVVDPETLRTVREVPVPVPPLSVAFAGGRGWVGSADGVRPFDVDSGAVGDLVPTPVRPYRLAAVGDRLVVSGPDGVLALDGATGSPGATTSFDVAGSITVAAGEEGAWVALPSDDGTSTLQRVALPSLAADGPAREAGTVGTGLALTREHLWLADPAGTLSCADPRTGDVLGQRPTPTAGLVVADDAGVVVSQARGMAGFGPECG